MYPYGQLFLGKHAVGRRLAGRHQIAVCCHVLLEGHLIGPAPPTPEAMAVARLVHGDAVDPRAQARLATEPMDGPEHPEEHLLRKVERLVAIAQQVHRQLDDHPLLFGNQFRAGCLVP